MNASNQYSPGGKDRRLSIFVIIISLAIFTIPAVSSACSPSDFILDEFALRCKDLAEQVRDTELAHRMGFPDAASRSARLLDGWLSFFLDHGIAPPPVYQTLSGHGWEEGMRSLGSRIGSIGRGETVSAEALEMSTLPLDLLGAPETLITYRQALASLSQRIDELAGQLPDAGAGAGSSPVPLAADDPAVADAMLALTRCFEESPFLRKRLETLHFSMTSIAPAGGTATGSSMPPEDTEALAELQLGLLQEELRILGPIGFWQPVASQTLVR